jgi:hypothetical protein
MWTAASVLACALSVLGRGADMPRIELIDVAPPYVSKGAEAFVRRDNLTIYLITSSSVFQTALKSRVGCSASTEMQKLASILAHEAWHVRHGPDEKSAYEHQLITLIQLGVQPGSGTYHSVQVSMLRILEARKRNKPDKPELLLAGLTLF